MAAAKQWLWGCGIGCAVVLLLAIGAIVALGLFLGSTVRGFEDAVEAREQLEGIHGPASTFAPAADGSIAAGRIDAFLAVRDASMEARDLLERAFESITVSAEEAEQVEDKSFGEKLGFVFGIAKEGLGLGGRLGDFLKARNEALLAHGMGFGEYSYLYCVVFYGWLDHDPGDGPQLGPDTEIEVDGQRFGEMSPRTRADLRQILRNQLAVVPENDQAWRATLQAEIDALEQDGLRYPWRDGVPPALAASLEPFRERLAASYRPRVNPFELVQGERKGKFSIEGR